MLVTRSNLAAVCRKLSLDGFYGLDCETSGLGQEDRLFSIILHDENQGFYFNFNTNAQNTELILDRCETIAKLQPVFQNPNSTFLLSNAKFDLRMLSKEGFNFFGNIHCTEAIERVIYNAHMLYGLDACAKRRGLEKSKTVEEYIQENKLTSKVTVPGKKNQVTLKHFDRVPFEIMHKYAEHDAYLSRTIALDQDRQIEELDKMRDVSGHLYPSLKFLVENEKRLTKTLARVEGYGIRIDPVRTEEALNYELGRAAAGRKAFLEYTGEEFVSSGKSLGPIFDRFGIAYPRTDKGNPSFKADWLDELPDTTPLGSLINGIRRPEKRAGTYYGAYLHLATAENRIHCDIRQGGTETGRLSARDPNLTNIPKEDDEEDLDKPFHVRECFIPDEGFFFLDIDWQQIQYRIMADLAGETKLIKAIMDGEDVHVATARLCGITRKHAKTLNFALLFGARAKKISGMLGVKVSEAQELIDIYFSKLLNVEKFIKSVEKTGRARGWVFSPYGRRCHAVSDEFAYALPNHIIQGAEGDTLKIAMNEIDELLIRKKARSRMALPVHDQVLSNWHPNELDLVSDVVDIMESVYDKFSQNGMKLLTSTEHSFTRWGKRHLVKGLPNGQKVA